LLESYLRALAISKLNTLLVRNTTVIWGGEALFKIYFMKFFSQGWYVLYVNSRYEKKVHDSINEIRIDSFLPLVESIRHWKDRKKVLFTPLFPSYVFVHLKSRKDSYRVLKIKGACTFIKIGNTMVKVREQEINKIKLMVNDNFLFDFEVTNKQFSPGEKRKFNDGLFNGQEYEVIRIDKKEKILIRIDSLSQNITASFSDKYLTYFSHAV